MSTFAMKEITGRHVLIGLLTFFGIMLIANGLFIYFALSTFDGPENPNAYRDGLDYNRRIAIAEAQSELGWTHRIKTGAGRLELSLRDRDGKPVYGITLKAEVRRPVGDAEPALLQFSQNEDGIFLAGIDALAPGNWVVLAEARRRNGEIIYRIKERLWLKPNS